MAVTHQAGFASKHHVVNTNPKPRRGKHVKIRLASSLTLRVSVF